MLWPLGRPAAKFRSGSDVAVYRDQLEEILFTADIGAKTAHKLFESVKASLSRNELKDADAVWTVIRRESETILAETQEDEVDLEERLLEILLEHDDRAAVREGVRALGNEMASAQGRQLEAEALTAAVLR